MSAPLLVVEHQPNCPAGLLGRRLLHDGVRLDVRRPHAGDPLPSDLDGHGGLLVLGGGMGAMDDEAHPWLAEVKALVRRAAAAERTVLGVCLGHQLAAVALGGRVERNPRGKQLGLLEIGWTAHAAKDPLLGSLAGRGSTTLGAHWNDDIATRLPPAALVLARARGGEVQAARLAPTVWGVQWHPEVDVGILRAWAEEEAPARPDLLERFGDVVADAGHAEEELAATATALADALSAVLARSVVHV